MNPNLQPNFMITQRENRVLIHLLTNALLPILDTNDQTLRNNSALTAMNCKKSYFSRKYFCPVSLLTIRNRKNFDEIPMTAMFDTGSEITLIKEENFTQLGLKYHTAVIQNVVQVCGTQSDILGFTWLGKNFPTVRSTI